MPHKEWVSQEMVSIVGEWLAENPGAIDSIENKKGFFFRLMSYSVKSIVDKSTVELKDLFVTHPVAEVNLDLERIYSFFEDVNQWGATIKSNNKGNSGYVFLKWLKDYPTEDIMKSHGISKGAVSQSVKKGKEMLESFLGEPVYSGKRIYRHGFTK